MLKIVVYFVGFTSAASFHCCLYFSLPLSLNKLVNLYVKSYRTVVSLGDGTNNQESTKDQIFENIRLHKEVLQSVKMQPWSMRRKLRLVRQVSSLFQTITILTFNNFHRRYHTSTQFHVNEICIAYYKRFLSNILTSKFNSSLCTFTCLENIVNRPESTLHVMRERSKTLRLAAQKIYMLALKSF